MEDSRPLLARRYVTRRSPDAGRRGAPSRHELIDSRDNYDPRSLDPALSTDVPTGRAVGYLFDGLTRFTPDAKVEPALAERWDVSRRRPDLHLPSPPRRHIPRRLAVHRAQRRRAAGSARSIPTTKSGAAQFLFPIKGARRVQRRNGQDDRRPRRSRRQHGRRHARRAARDLHQDARDAGRLDRSRTTSPANFGEHPIGTGPWKLVEWKHDDYLLFAKNPSYFGGAPKAESLRARIIAEPSTARRRVRERQRRRAPDSRQRGVATGRRTRAGSRC